jgi:hypothetical protein
MTTRVGVGFSQLDDPLEAGRRAAEQAVEPLAGQAPNLVVLFCTPELEPGQVLTGVRAVTGQVPLVGGCSTGIIVPQGAFSRGVAVLALQSKGMQVIADVALEINHNPEGVGRALVQRLLARREKPGRAVGGLLLAVIDAQQIGAASVKMVQTMGDELGPLCPLVGGGAQDPDGRVERPLFLNGELYSDAVVAALLVTAQPVGVGVRHGYTPLGRPLVVTRAEGNVLYELDGRSAFEAYQEQFSDRPELSLENFGPFAVDHPLGLPQMGREYIVRDPYSAQPDGSLMCAGAVPEHSIVRIMMGDRETMIRSAREAAAEAVQPLGERQSLVGFVFSCVTRLGYLGAAAQEEVVAIGEAMGAETPFIGLFSFGEIAAQQDSPSTVHNKTAVVGVLGEA